MSTALQYARMGYGVFAVVRNGKAPATQNGLKDATTDPVHVAAWADSYNVGLLPSKRVLVLDADSSEEATRLEREYPELTAAPRCDTPSGGAHFYTRLPEGVKPPKTSTKVQGRKLDIRGLGKAYLVAPPSTNKTGAYTWSRPLVSPDELPETPAEVLDLLKPSKPGAKMPPMTKPTFIAQGGNRSYALAALRAEHDKVANAVEGRRNDMLNRAAFALGQFVGAGQLERNEVEDTLRKAAQRCGLNLYETEATLKSGLSAGISEPRNLPQASTQAASLHYAKGVNALKTPTVTNDGSFTAGGYADKGNVIYRRKTKMAKVADGWQEEVEDTPLCNFSARIVEERVRDDGVERTLTFILTGTLESGRALSEVEVNAAQFGGMGWAVSEWGTQAVVYAGQGTKDHLRAAIQMLSGDVPRRTTYTHLGWREVEGHKIYLHAGGVIAPNAPPNVQVEPPQGLEGFVLPQPPSGDELRSAVRASLNVLNLAPDTVTVPLLGMAYRSLFGSVDFGGHLSGQTGAGKSELAAVMQQHFGSGLDARHLPGSWSSTANALEGLAFGGKDVLVTIDDFAPEGSSHEIQRYHATAARLFRAQGNNAARGRMRADGSLRPNKPPRGFVLSTGEDIPKGHSIKARTLILELEPGALDWQRLTEAQRLASDGVYAAATSGFIYWLAEDYYGHIATFKKDHAHFRDTLQRGGHKRTVDAEAQLMATYKAFLDFASESDALTHTEQTALWQRVEAGIHAALEPQAALQAQSDPVARFGELLVGLFVSGRTHVAHAATGEYPDEGWGWESYEVHSEAGSELNYRPKGKRIGWVDDMNLYLEPSATYAELQSFARDQGDSLPVTERTLWKRLIERGVIDAPEKGHATVKRSCPGSGRIRVLNVQLSHLYKSGETGAGRLKSV